MVKKDKVGDARERELGVLYFFLLLEFKRIKDLKLVLRRGIRILEEKIEINFGREGIEILEDMEIIFCSRAGFLFI